MDGIVIMVLTFVLFIANLPKESPVGDGGIPVTKIEVNPRLNPTMYHDEHAFMKIANELGFH